MFNGTSARCIGSESAIRTKADAMTTCWTDQESRTVNAVLLHHDGCTEGTDISRLKSPCEIAIHRAAFGYALLPREKRSRVACTLQYDADRRRVRSICCQLSLVLRRNRSIDKAPR